MNAQHNARAHPCSRRFARAALLAGAGLLLTTALHAQMQLVSSVIGSGGSQAIVDGRLCASTIGQSIIGETGHGVSRAYQGFWVPRTTATLGVDRERSSMTANSRFSLRCIPNPMSASAVMSLKLEHSSHVTMRVMDLLGRTVTTLFDETTPAGELTVNWNGQDEAGVPVANGTYHLILSVVDQVNSTNALTTERQTLTVLR